jgi:hypothetical protein
VKTTKHIVLAVVTVAGLAAATAAPALAGMAVNHTEPLTGR